MYIYLYTQNRYIEFYYYGNSDSYGAHSNLICLQDINTLVCYGSIILMLKLFHPPANGLQKLICITLMPWQFFFKNYETSHSSEYPLTSGTKEDIKIETEHGFSNQGVSRLNLKRKYESMDYYKWGHLPDFILSHQRQISRKSWH